MIDKELMKLLGGGSYFDPLCLYKVDWSTKRQDRKRSKKRSLQKDLRNS